MSRQTVKLPSLANVAAGGTATLQCPVGKTYDKIVLEYTGVTRAQLENIEVLLNGKVVQTFADGDELDLINDYYGRSDTAGFLTLHFNRPEMESTEQQRITGLGTLDVQNMQLRLDVAAAAAAPVITAHAQVSAPRPLGLFTKIKRFSFNSSVAGQIEIDNIPRGPRILAMHLIKADVDDIEVELDSVKVVDTSKGLAQVLQKEAGRVPQTAKATHVDFTQENDISQALITEGAQDFRLKPTLGTSGAMGVVVEYLDGYAGL